MKSNTEKILQALTALLWSLTALCCIAILACNALYADKDLPAYLSPLLSYGFLYSTGFAMLCQTFYRKKDNSSDTSFGLKLLVSTLFLLSVTASFIKMLLV